jgi:hypothetical protein
VIGMLLKVWPFLGTPIVAAWDGGALGITPSTPVESDCGPGAGIRAIAGTENNKTPANDSMSALIFVFTMP